ncbi:MAG: acyl-CoA/acyl-ACP dehydrogenase [Caryophanon sp.]|nr:acyl-CoA/acyl-ACP dehydrogenase [Caryophanon sp.]
MFVQNDIQQHWIEKLQQHRDFFLDGAAERDETRTFPLAQIEWLAREGYGALTLPTAYGGKGLSVSSMIAVQETLASIDGSTALAIGWQLGVVGDLYEKQLWDQHMLAFLAHEIKDGALINRNASEAATGSPTRGGRPETTAVQDGDFWVLNGHKTFATTSPALRYFIVTAWCAEKNSICHFLVPKAADGVTLEKTWNTVAMRATASDDLLLQNVRIPLHYLVEELQAPRAQQLNGWLLHIPACYLGIAQAARNYAIHYAKTYAPNSINTTISELPNVQMHIGHIEQELLEMRHFLYSVARMYDDPQLRTQLTEELGAAKTKVMNGALKVVDLAMRICGAHSLQMTCPLQRYYRDVRAGLHNPPMEDITVMKLAKHALCSYERG